MQITIKNLLKTFKLAFLLIATAVCTPVGAQERVGRQQPKQPPQSVGGYSNGEVEIDFELMKKKLTQALQDKGVGYGFAIFHNGIYKKNGAGGDARRSPDTPANFPVSFQTASRIDIASCTKTITAIAVLKALEVKGKTDDELIYKYLPSNWKIHASVKKLTFRDVLSHHSGLKKVTDGTYDGIRKSIEAGVSPGYTPGNYSEDEDYQNINFVLCRILLPYLDGGGIAITENDSVKGPETIGLAFADLVRRYVFKPAGINKPVQFKPWDESGNLSKLPLHYNFKDSSVAGLMSGDHTLTGGAGGLIINAGELAQVMSALENDKLLSLNMRMRMKQHELGIFKSGAYYTHSGGFSDGKGRGGASRLVLCPNNIQVAIVINSAGNSTGSTFDIVKDAVEDSISKP